MNVNLLADSSEQETTFEKRPHTSDNTKPDQPEEASMQTLRSDGLYAATEAKEPVAVYRV